MDQPPNRPFYSIFLSFFSLLIACSSLISAQTLVEKPIATPPTTWINNFSSPIRDMNLMRFQPILTRGSPGPWFSCGFFCNYTNNECLFALLIFPNSSVTKQSRVVWSANRNNPVSLDATLVLGEDGNLALAHANGTLVWTTNTSRESVSPGLNLTDMGNLVLFDKKTAFIWQSFDHPTDTLLPGQALVSGEKLVSNVSSTDWGEGLYSVSLSNTKLVAYMESNPPQRYYLSNNELEIPTNRTRAYVRFEDGSLGGYNMSYGPYGLKAQFLRLEADGHVNLYNWRGLDWVKAFDFLTLFIGDCGYPMGCGNYGICSGKGQCSCPGQAENDRVSYFRQNSERQPNLGCSLITPISCNYSQFQSLLELKNISYSSLDTSVPFEQTDLANCKNTCLGTCYCKSVVFQYNPLNDSTGNCYLLPEVFSFKDTGSTNSTIAYVKVQNPARMGANPAAIILRASLGALLGAYLIITKIIFFIWEENESKHVEDDYFQQLVGTPARYSYEQLRVMTENFSKKLGEGGFGTVFEGTLHNGTKVAVKRLDKLELVEKTFLAEVETIGNIHHVNLVRLIGFCIEKSHRLLVYEYMSNGSLNKWIFSKHGVVSLRWQSRRKIILDIAKGLAYLHDGCRQKIFHLDIKPQNILLDDNFNAKLSDFGLSKLIDKDQSRVVTTIKGTPGYMAPEWLSSFITEKVDVYSFGVVVLEILCGRRNLDRSQPEEDMHLLSLFKRKVDEDELLEMVDKCSEDMKLHGEEAVEMMRVAAWCLQSDFEKRPSMAMVVQAVEGLVNIEDNLDYNFTEPPTPRRAVAAMDEREGAPGTATLLLPSVLSGPR